MSPVFYTPYIAMPHFCKVCQLWYHHERDAGDCCYNCWKNIKNQEYNQPSEFAKQNVSSNSEEEE